MHRVIVLSAEVQVKGVRWLNASASYKNIPFIQYTEYLDRASNIELRCIILHHVAQTVWQFDVQLLKNN